MKAILFLQGSLGALNSRDGQPLFMELVRGRPLLDLLLSEASSSGVFDRTVFVTSSAACDDAVARFLQEAWSSVEVVRLGVDSPYALGPQSRREHLLGADDYSGILSVEGFNAIAARSVREPSQAAFVLDVNDAPVCSRRFFERAVPLAREAGFYSAVPSGATSLCGFQMRSLVTMSGHQRSLRVAESATVKERVERVMQEARRERYLGSDEQIEAVHAWQRARAELYAPFRGGLLSHTVRDYVARHTEADVRERFARQTRGEAVAVTTSTALEMVRTALDTPDPGDLGAVERWLLDCEERRPHQDGQRLFWPDYPSYLEVELTSRCNLACRFCPQTKLNRPTGDLEYDKLEALLERVADFVTLLNFSGFGEPTLHPRLFDCIRLAKAKGIPRVELETNGTTVDEAFLDQVFASGLDVFSVNLDAADQSRTDESGNAAFGSAYELVKRFIERRGAAARPFLVLERINMAVANQDAKVQRDFALWYDVADAFVIKAFNTYRGAFPDKRVINFAPLERTACRKVLASALVLSSGEAVMCEQCFDGEQPGSDVPLDASGRYAFGSRLRAEQDKGIVRPFCASCSQWYQQDVPWPAPSTYRLWTRRALLDTAARVATCAVERFGASLGDTCIPQIVARTGDYAGAVQALYEQTLGAARRHEFRPAMLPAYRACLGASGSGPSGLVEPVACAVLADRVYVTDGGARRVAAFTLDGERVTTFGTTCKAHGRLPDIAALDGVIFIAGPDQIQRFTPEGELLGVLAPDLGAPISSIAAGPSGLLVVGTDRARVVLLDVQSGEVAVELTDPSWVKVFVSSSPEQGELYVSNIHGGEVYAFDLGGRPVRRVRREDIGRLDSPAHVLRVDEGRVVIANWGLQELLVLTPELDVIGALPAPGLRGSSAAGGGRLFTIVNGENSGCHVWDTAGAASAAAR